MGHSYKGGGGLLVSSSPPNGANVTITSPTGGHVHISTTTSGATFYSMQSSNSGVSYAQIGVSTVTTPTTLTGFTTGDLAYVTPTPGTTTPDAWASNVVTVS
jgi:hypothetical protein